MRGACFPKVTGSSVITDSKANLSFFLRTQPFFCLKLKIVSSLQAAFFVFLSRFLGPRIEVYGDHYQRLVLGVAILKRAVAPVYTWCQDIRCI